MHLTPSLAALLATLTLASADPLFRFSEYGSGDLKCKPKHLISPSVSINDAYGSCYQFPMGTSSIQYKLLEGSRKGCTVELWTDPACNGPAIKSFVPKVGEQGCVPPVRGGWESVQVTCPKA